MAPKRSTFIHGPNTIDIHSWLARIHVNNCRSLNNCMGAFLFYANAFSMKQMSKRIEGNRKQGKCYSLKLSAFGSVRKLMKAGERGGEAVGTGVLTAYVWECYSVCTLRTIYTLKGLDKYLGILNMLLWFVLNIFCLFRLSWRVSLGFFRKKLQFIKWPSICVLLWRRKRHILYNSS